MKYCHGNNEGHCCWLGGVLCPFLEENTVEGRRWACGLFRELGDWELVHEDHRYIDKVLPLWMARDELRIWADQGCGCGDWPQNIPSEMRLSIGKCCWDD